MSAGKGKKSSSEAGAASPSATAPAKKATTKKATAGKEADGQAAGRKSREKASGRKPEKVTGAKGPQIPAAERTDAGVAERSPADGPASNPFREVMRRQSAPEPATLVIFGVSGDLARRKLLPAIFGLFQDGLLSSAVQILGVGRQEMLAGEFQSFVEQALRESSETDEIDEASLGAFLETLAYCAGDLAGPEVYGQIAALCSEHETSNALFYLSLPPSLFITVSDGLAAQDLHRQDEGWRRLVIEKPFGRDLESARDLQARLTRHWDESQIYRIDHYLGKETVQNLLAIRFGNAIFEPL